MSEREKYWAGLPYDEAKLYAEMDDDFWEKTMEGLRGPAPADPKNPPSAPDHPA